MSQTNNQRVNNLKQRATSILAATTFALVSVFGVASSANASEMAPVIEYDGNNLANTFIHSQFGLRPVQFQVGLDPTPLNQVLSTNRSGYSFGGWSYAPGEPAVTTLQTASHTTTRMWLYAVWNTKVNLDTNGSTRGQLQNREASITYRYGQSLTLPSGGTIAKKGYEFAGWSNAPTSTVVMTTYRAEADSIGNPTLYAVWKKTVGFSSRGSTGVAPSPITIFEGSSPVALPTAAQVSLTRSGFTFVGWSTTPRGKAIKNSAAYMPKKANVTLHAVWKRN